MAFLDCLRQLMEYVQVKEPGLKLPYSIVKDKVGDISIKLQFGSEEVWTRALRHVCSSINLIQITY